MAVAVVMFGCGENGVSIGNPPPAPQFTVDQADPNRPIFKVTSAEGFMINWDFGNGKYTQDSLDTVYYPFADTYTVKLTASNKGGATTTKKKVVIAETDPRICLNKYYTLLTGGCDIGTKIWKFDSADGAMANGPPSSKDSLGNGTSNYNDHYVGTYWWQSTLAGVDAGNPPTPPKRALDDEYVFGLRGFTYKNDCHGDFYFNWMWANKFFNLTQAQYHDTIHSYTPNNPATWTLDVDSVTPEDMTAKDSTTWKKRFFTDSATGKRFNLILTLSNGNYIGYCSGFSVFEILSFGVGATADTMYLRHELLNPDKPNLTGSNRTEWRYSRFVSNK
jgi:PKD repeat protein